MPNGNYGTETAAEVMKQLITIGAVTMGAVLGLALQKSGNDFERATSFISVLLGACAVFGSLLFLTDIAAKSLGTTPKPLVFRRRLFMTSWALFLGSVVSGALFVLSRAGVV